MAVSRQDYLARNARNPHVAGLLVAATAAGFTPLWFLMVAAIGGVGVLQSESPFLVGFFLLVTPVNAYLVTRVSWRQWVAGRSVLATDRAAVVGAVIGVVS